MKRNTILTRLSAEFCQCLFSIGETFCLGAAALAAEKLGGKLVDSSPMYGNSEEVVGDLAAQLGLQKKLFIATKVWTSGRQEGITQMEDSMRKLRADPIDLMQVRDSMKAAFGPLPDEKLRARVAAEAI